MCGIMAAITENAAETLYKGLKLLEYRGYDSCGVAVKSKDSLITTVRKKGEVKNLQGGINNLIGNIGVAHTRWATHGEPKEENAHPITENGVSVVHNGIIENYCQLKKDFDNFHTETDSEIIVKLVNSFMGTPIERMKNATERITGTYAIAAIIENEIIIARNFSPIFVGVNDDGVYAMSDLNSLKSFCYGVYEVEDGEFCKLDQKGAAFYDNNLVNIEKTPCWTSSGEVQEEIAVDNLMEKEINETPLAIEETIKEYFKNPFKRVAADKIKNADRVIFVACGTAYHAAMTGRTYFLSVGIESQYHLASEFIYEKNFLTSKSVVIAVSQSGETADTVMAVKRAKSMGAYVISLTNTENSYVTKYSDVVFYTKCGLERAVAATKSFSAQVLTLFLIASEIASDFPFTELNRLSLITEFAIKIEVENYAKLNASAKEVFFIGRGIGYPLSLEGALKVKEVSGIISEGYAAGELKHGTLSLIDDKSVVYAIIIDKGLLEKTLNSAREISSRGGKVILITPYVKSSEFEIISLPETIVGLNVITAAAVMQNIALKSALLKGLNPDKPKNLAKSVTCE